MMKLRHWLRKKFFHKDFDETLKSVYGDSIDPKKLVVEGGVVE